MKYKEQDTDACNLAEIHLTTGECRHAVAIAVVLVMLTQHSQSNQF